VSGSKITNSAANKTSSINRSSPISLVDDKIDPIPNDS